MPVLEGTFTKKVLVNESFEQAGLGLRLGLSPRVPRRISSNLSPDVATSERSVDGLPKDLPKPC